MANDEAPHRATATASRTARDRDAREEVERERKGSPDSRAREGDDGAEGGNGSATRATAEDIHATVKKGAEEELDRSAAGLAWSALAAGLTISFSFLAGAYLASLLGPDSERAHRHAAAAVGYPLGFMFVVLARSQLFTEHTLQPLIPLFDKFTRRTLGKVLRLYAIVLAGNLVGGLLLALALAHTRMVQPELHPSLSELAHAAMEGGAATVFYKAIFAGWLIALMAWLVAATHSTAAQLLFIWITTAPIAALGFRHSIAGSVEVLYLAARGETGWLEAVTRFIVPAVLGNVVGGGVIVALLNHSQVAADKKQHEKEHESQRLEHEHDEAEAEARERDAQERDARERRPARGRPRFGLHGDGRPYR